MNYLKVQVLGLGCPKCKQLYDLVSRVAARLDPTIEVEYVTDISKLMELGVMSMPVFVVNGRVITSGRMPKDDEIIEALKQFSI